MLLCRVCHKELTNLNNPCPRCGFRELSFVGDPKAAEQKMNKMADEARAKFLSEFDFGVTIYRWKDQDGTLVLDRTERLSFGSGTALLDKLCWLDQPFARIPDMQKMELELSVQKNGRSYRGMKISVPVPQGNYLQQVGITLSPDMKVKLLLKNPQGQTQSASTAFLLD